MLSARKLQAKIADGLYTLANAFVALARWCLWPRSRPVQAKSVCLYRIAHLGDTICALPAMHAVRIAYPEARLTLITSPGKRGMPGARELLAGAPWLEDLVVYYNDEVRSLRQRLALAKGLRQRRFDVWIEFPNDLATIPVLLRNMLLARLSGARWGYGWMISTIRWGARAQSESKVFPSEVDRLLGVVERCGIPAQQADFPLPITINHVSTVDALFRESVPSGVPLVAIAPGAKRPANRWPLDRFAEVAQVLSRQGFFVLLMGGAGDKEPCDGIASSVQGRHSEPLCSSDTNGPFGSLRAGSERSAGDQAEVSQKYRPRYQPRTRVLNLAGRLSVVESCEALRRCMFVVCNDSGVQHMAAAVSTPCISIFSDRDMPDKWRPYGAQHIVLQRDVPCHTCYLDECPHDNLCVKLVQVSDVLRASDLLGSRVRESGSGQVSESAKTVLTES